ncbi:hypothetical protein KCV01_g2694, partial [Aureobasidium melanogenum]
MQRAQLEPFQRLELDLMLKGELATLRDAEPVGPVMRLTGDAGMAGLYLNELVVRLTGRQDPNPGLFERYERTLRRMAAAEPLAWTLRRFERDMLDSLGYALQLEFDAGAGEPLDPSRSYYYDPEAGATPGRVGDPQALRGADLLALAADEAPDAAGLASLRRMMRQVISFHLGGGELKAWRVLR